MSLAISINVKTQYLDGRILDKSQFPFAYTITISNKGKQDVQLLNRYWLITDGDGKKTEVQGAGVVGEQPVICPNESYEYTSGAILDTPVGTMQGYYEMQWADGELFQVPIEVFSLAVPNVLN